MVCNFFLLFPTKQSLNGKGNSQGIRIVPSQSIFTVKSVRTHSLEQMFSEEYKDRASSVILMKHSSRIYSRTINYL